MKLNFNIAIFILLLITLSCQSARHGTKKSLKSSLKRSLTSNETLNNMKEAAETVENSGINKNSSILEWIQLGTNIATGFIKEPYGQLVRVSTDILFSIVDKEIIKPTNQEIQSNNNNNNIESIDTAIKKSLKNINNKLETLQNNIMKGTKKIIDDLTTLVESLPAFKDLRVEIQTIIDYYNDYNYKCFISNDTKACPKVRKEEIIDTLINPLSARNIDLNKFIIKYIQTTGTPTDLMYHDKGVFEIMIDDYYSKIKKGQDCGRLPVRYSIQKVLMHILFALKKYETMIIEAHFTRYRNALKITNNQTRLFEKSKELHAVTEVIAQFNDRIMSVIKSARIALEGTSTEIRSCDPPKNQNKRGVTWERFNLLFPIYIDYVQTCPNGIGLGYYHGYTSLMTDTELFRCQEIPNVKKISIYQEKKLNPDRPLFNHVEVLFNNNSKQLYGDPKRNQSNLVVLENGKFKDNTCNKSAKIYAICKIPPEIDFIVKHEVRYVSLAPVVTTPNYVVTGIRWKFINRMLYLEIQQGQLVNNNVINTTTVHWKSTEEHEKNEKAIMIDNSLVKGFGLKNTILPSGYFVTGVQFDWDDTITNSRLLKINVQGTSFDNIDDDGFETTDVIWEKTDWNEFEKEIELEEPDRSEYATNNEVFRENDEVGHFIYFRNTDIIKDGGQTSIPYLDIQSVAVDTPVPLEGIGVYYKGQKGYGGYLGLRALIPDGSEMVAENQMKIYSMTSTQIWNIIKKQKPINMTAVQFIDSLDIPEK